jgi:hypothetical protein
MKRVGVAGLLLGASLAAQTPQPFPRPGSQPPRPAPQQPAPQQPAPPAAAGQPAPKPGPVDPDAPTEATLGLPIYPNAQFIASYDAGRGQRYYIFGATQSFEAMVTYYRTYLRERGNLVFEEPPTHMFEVGRFDDDTMAFPPGITIKDYTWGGSKGYPNPKRGVEPERFPTIIMIVPAPAP